MNCIQRLWLTLAGVALSALQVSPAGANSTGIVGYSGKQGHICNECHGGGTAPVVSFDGPMDVSPGAMATFRFVVRSQAPTTQNFAGFGVAASAGQLNIVQGQGERLLGSEITHTSPKANDANGEASFEFTWKAPDAPGTYTLFGDGNSVNHNSTNQGDLALSTTLMVVVVPTPTLTPTPTPTPTATFGLGPCVGDCNYNGMVTVTELITAVNIALGSLTLDACPAFGSSNAVTVTELLRAVNAVLNGCRP